MYTEAYIFLGSRYADINPESAIELINAATHYTVYVSSPSGEYGESRITMQMRIAQICPP